MCLSRFIITKSPSEGGVFFTRRLGEERDLKARKFLERKVPNWWPVSLSGEVGGSQLRPACHLPGLCGFSPGLWCLWSVWLSWKKVTPCLWSVGTVHSQSHQLLTYLCHPLTVWPACHLSSPGLFYKMGLITPSLLAGQLLGVSKGHVRN